MKSSALIVLVGLVCARTIARQFAARQIVPVFNVAIYQDGTISPRTIELFKQ